VESLFIGNHIRLTFASAHVSRSYESKQSRHKWAPVFILAPDRRLQLRQRTIPLMAMVLLVALPLAAQVAGSKTPDATVPPKTPVTAADLRIAQRAADILSSPQKWNHIDTDKCPVGARKFSLYCALEKSSQEVTGQENDRSAVMQEARITADFMAPKRYGARLVDYNNDPSTRFQDIREFFRILRNRLTRRMAEAVPGATLAARGEGISQSGLQ
jgi:hypothetical protein